MIKTIVLASLLIAATTVNASVLPVAQGEASSFQASGNSGTAAPLDLSPSAGAPGADRLSAPTSGQVSVVPEPETYALLGLGLVGVVMMRQRRRHRS
jgi:hypothetical protein